MEPCNLIQRKATEIWQELKSHPSVFWTSAISMTIGKRVTVHHDPGTEIESSITSPEEQQLPALVIWSSVKRDDNKGMNELDDVRDVLNNQLRAQVSYVRAQVVKN